MSDEEFPLKRIFPKLDRDKLFCNRYLVIQQLGGESGIQNVGIYLAKNADDARMIASKEWHTLAKLDAYILDELPDGWSYFQ